MHAYAKLDKNGDLAIQARKAADDLNEAMNMTGYLPDSPEEPGLSRQHSIAQKKYNNVLGFLRKLSED